MVRRAGLWAQPTSVLQLTTEEICLRIYNDLQSNATCHSLSLSTHIPSPDRSAMPESSAASVANRHKRKTQINSSESKD